MFSMSRNGGRVGKYACQVNSINNIKKKMELYSYFLRV